MNLASHPTLPGLIEMALTHKNSRGIGMAGELTARKMLEKAGYQVTRAPQLHGDLRAIDPTTGETWDVEVKTARRSKDRKWRFTLVLQGKGGRTDHRHADVVLLLAVLKSGRCIPFLIPVSELLNQRQAVICSHPESYAGKLAQYRQTGSLRL